MDIVSLPLVASWGLQLSPYKLDIPLADVVPARNAAGSHLQNSYKSIDLRTSAPSESPLYDPTASHSPKHV